MIKPCFVWAGSKRESSQVISSLFPPVIPVYREPFIGSGAVFLKMADRIEQAHLSDANPHLINTWSAIQSMPVTLAGLLAEHQDKHSSADVMDLGIRTDPKHYYYVVRKAFNHHKDEPAGVYAAARFLYLVKKCINGIVRFNRSGGFNAPMGHGKRPLPSANDLLACQRALTGSGELHRATISVLDGIDALNAALSGEYVYLDPPYEVLSKTSSFRGYTAAGWPSGRVMTLVEAMVRAVARGVNVVASQAYTEGMERLYRDAGFKIRLLQIRRSVNTKGDGRGRVPEILAWAGSGIVQPKDET